MQSSVSSSDTKKAFGALDTPADGFKHQEISELCSFKSLIMSSGWKYSKNQSTQHKPEVVDFLKQLFPQRNSRNFILSYLARIVTDGLHDEKIICLSDKQGNGSGKTTFITFLKQFFGEYALQVSNHSRYRNQEANHSKRLYLFDNPLTSKNRKFDINFILEKGSSAGAVISFKEGGMPNFKLETNVICEKVSVVCMESKFTDSAVVSNESNTNIKKDLYIASRFSHWNSAFLDLLVQYTETAVKEPISAKWWTKQLVVSPGADSILRWFHEHVKITNKTSDLVLLRTLNNMYLQTVPNNYGTKMFCNTIVNYLQGLSIPKTRINGLRGFLPGLVLRNNL